MSSNSQTKKLVEIKKIIETDDDYIACPKFKNSLKLLISRFPDSVDDDKIAKYLMISESEVKKLYQSAIQKLRKGLKL